MIETFSATLAGTALGFASSTPLGVINLWVADATLARTEGRLLWFLAGVIACDALFAALAAWGYHAFLDDSSATSWLELGGGLFLIFLGARHGKPAVIPSATSASGIRRPVSDFALGATLCGSNPAFLMFWVVAVGALNEELGMTFVGLGVSALVLGVIIGDALWFLLLMRLVRRGRDVLTAVTLARCRRGIGLAFVGLGLYVALQGARSLLAS